MNTFYSLKQRNRHRETAKTNERYVFICILMYPFYKSTVKALWKYQPVGLFPGFYGIIFVKYIPKTNRSEKMIVFFKYLPCRQVLISNLSSYFPRKVWLLIIVPEGILFQNHEIPTSQTWTTSLHVTMTSSYLKFFGLEKLNKCSNRNKF